MWINNFIEVELLYVLEMCYYFKYDDRWGYSDNVYVVAIVMIILMWLWDELLYL